MIDKSTPTDFFEKVAMPDNLAWAWQKVRHFYQSDINWFDEIELSRFELNLEAELSSIANGLGRATYKLSPLLPVPFPKKSKEDDAPEVRQMFYIQLRDQVAWMAVVNVLGWQIDNQMPEWSYGNRLYRSAWLEESEFGDQLRLGPYRNSSGLTYRKFQHSWPLYRRYVLLTLRQMSRLTQGPKYLLSDAEDMLLKWEESGRNRRRHPYLRSEHWGRRFDSVYWTSLDFEKFYPNIPLTLVHDNLLDCCGVADSKFEKLIHALLDFRVDNSGYSERELEQLGIGLAKYFGGLPTGLIVSGFLANVAMLAIDKKVSILAAEYPVAHFRYVDDHIVLAPSFKKLIDWVDNYREILADSGVATINDKKCEPAHTADYLAARLDLKSIEPDDARARLLVLEAKARSASHVDPDYPTPLLTTTLAKVSAIAGTDFELLHDSEQESFLDDVEHLLLADLPETELRSQTRVSFAATILSRYAGHFSSSSRALVKIKARIESIRAAIDALGAGADSNQKELSELRAMLSAASDELDAELEGNENRSQKLKVRYLYLLLKALAEHPDRLRIWQRVLDYCQNAALDLQEVSKRLQRFSESNPLSGKYVYAYVLQHLARQVLANLRVIREQANKHPDQVDRAAKYLREIGLFKVPPHIDESRHFYVLRARHALHTALAASKVVLRLGDMPAGSQHKQHRAKLGEHRSLVHMGEVVASIVEESEHPIAAWLWWIERSINAERETPSEIWSLISSRVTLDTAEAWSLITTYPQFCAVEVFSRIYDGSRKLSLGEQGWLLDCLEVNADMNSEALRIKLREVRGLENAKKVIRAMRSADKKLTLFRWAEWCARIAQGNAHDPRIGEWTCVEIARQVCNQLRLYLSSRNLEFYVQPHNILVPESWRDISEKEVNSGVLTWEKWIHLADKEPISFRKRNLVRDSRYYNTGGNTHDGWEVLHSVAILLLGLLRKNFLWSAPITSVRRDASWTNLIRSEIRRSCCSSWTRAILDACLLPRFRETFLLPYWQPGQQIDRDDDTASDDLQINSLEELQTFLNQSKLVLASGQITVRDYKPRQLVTISIEQLGESEWSPSTDDGDQLDG